MSLSQTLNLVSDTKPLVTNPVVKRRQRLVDGINRQIAMISTTEGEQAKSKGVGQWWWMTDDGSYLVAIKYGKRPLELAKGKFAISCPTTDDVRASLESVRESVLKRDLDEVLEKKAQEIRAKFGK